MNLHGTFITCYERRMAITVRQLVEMPSMRTWVFAGGGGLDRRISWAHVSELPDPTEWLDADELVMATGLGIPREPLDQRRYVERLAEAGLSGLMVGHRMNAPELSAEMAEAADERSFPVLYTSYEVPFTAVSRAVAEANRGEEHARLLEALRLYETVRQAAASAYGADLLARLGKIVGCRLSLVDPARGFSLVPGAPPAPREVFAALEQAVSGRTDPLPAVLRLGTGPRPAMALAVPASRPAVLISLPPGEASPDLSVLRHTAAILALEIERENAERERRRRLGAELLAGLVDGRVSAGSGARFLAERGLDREPRVLAVCAVAGGEAEHSDLHLRLDDRGIPHLLLRRAPFLTVLLPDTDGALEGFRAEITPGYAVGLSDPLGRADRAPDAQREARWALEGARQAGEPLARYGEENASAFFLPRSLSGAERAVRGVLGPLLDYDESHNAELVRSLEVFLAHNRSWQKAASALHVHTQTLVYRIRRFEELTGRKTNQTGDVARLWLALETARASGLLKTAPPHEEPRPAIRRTLPQA